MPDQISFIDLFSHNQSSIFSLLVVSFFGYNQLTDQNSTLFTFALF
jgi:hypothetical protein